MLREIFASLGFQVDKKGFDQAKQATDGIKQSAQASGTAFDVFGKAVQAVVGAAIIRKTWELADGLAQQAVEIGNVAQQTGLSTDELQTWQFAAKESNIEASEFGLALRRLSTAIAGGVDETGSQSKIFEKLKISTHDAHHELRPLADILPEIAEHFKNMADGPAKGALATEIFGRQGAKLIPILNKGAAGVAALHAEFERLGGGFSPEAIKRAAEFRAETVKLTVAFDSLKSLLAISLLPQLTKAVDATTEGVVAFKHFAETTTLADHGVETLAATIALTLGAALAPYLLPGLTFLGLFLALDDAQAFVEGKGSLIGDALDAAFGAGTADVVRAWVNDAEDSLFGWAGAFKLVIADISASFSVEMAQIGKYWDEMLGGLARAWNASASLFLPAGLVPDALKFDPGKLEDRVNRDDDKIAAKQAARQKTQAAIANFNQATTAVSNPSVGGSPTGPVRAPIITQNFVEVKPNISITVPPGTSPAHAQRLVREAAAGVTATERRAALQGVDKRGGD